MFSKKSTIVLLVILVALILGACAQPTANVQAAGPNSTNNVSTNNVVKTAPVMLPSAVGEQTTAGGYPIVDTGQTTCYDNQNAVACPQSGTAFDGQDAQYAGLQPGYVDNGNGTVTDLNTGLMWQKTPDLNNKSTYAEAVAGAGTFNLAGYNDWRLPTIKELYSLTDFKGSSVAKIPYIDTNYFDFRFGDESRGERAIDAQYWSGTEYVGTVFNGQAAVFGVNFGDGRIKGYPRDRGPGGRPMTQFVRYVRGNPNYGINNFVDNSDPSTGSGQVGTLTDLATGLMWMKSDSGTTMNWESALGYCQNLDYAGYTDWRLPNAKELQSIVDYTQAPDAQNPARQGPAIDPIFSLTEPESWFWTGTTLLESPPHVGSGSQAVYVTFGQAFGVYQNLINVHGAGAQRSDPKSGNPANWAGGFGPQSDQIRINNYVRCVRDGGVVAAEITTFNPVQQPAGQIPSGNGLGQPPGGSPPGNQGGGTNQTFGAPPVNQSGQSPAGRTPPPEAIAACNGSSQGNSCQVNTPHGTLTGTCMIVPTQDLACVPQGGPPPGRP